MLRRILSLLLLLSFTLTSCSTTQFPGQVRTRSIASYEEQEVKHLQYLLAVDKFNYYINELIGWKSGKVDQAVVEGLAALTPEKIMDLGLSFEELNNSKQYNIPTYIRIYSNKFLVYSFLI